MRVLSLFDGISAGLQALKQAGIKVDSYHAAEVDKWAIKISTKNHPEIIQLGDVTKWTDWGFKLGDFDLIIGGSPCQGFSSAGKGLNFEDPRSKLFFEFVDILRYFKPKYFLFENVKMKKEWQNIIIGTLGVEPVEINSALVSAQNRKRLYWANWELGQPDDLGILLMDVIESGDVDRDKSRTIIGSIGRTTERECLSRKQGQMVEDRYYLSADAESNARTIKNLRELEGKGKTITAFGWGFGGSGVNLVPDGPRFRKLTPTECERLQTFPDDYTEGVSNTQRYKVLGNSWTVAVIEHIFRSGHFLDLTKKVSCQPE